MSGFPPCPRCGRAHAPTLACDAPPTREASGHTVVRSARDIETLSGPTAPPVLDDVEIFSGQAVARPPSPPPPTPPPPLSADPEALVGQMVGSFRLVRLLGKGGMGAVYLGEHPGIGSRVAIKMLHPWLASRPELVSRFYDEARAVNLIGHEHIIAIYDLNQLPPNHYYIVMEYLEGQALSQLLTDKPFDLKVATDILLQLCDALAGAHARNVVHRDLKPENVFLTRRGHKDHFVKLVDFGIAKLRDESTPGHQTQSGVLVGTPEYMSPEQADNQPVDARSDLYSLGLIAYRMVTGRLPFQEQSLARLILAHLTKPPPPPRTFNPELPQAYEDAILRALAKRPEDRFQDMRALGDALEAALHAPPVAASAPQVGTGRVPTAENAPAQPAPASPPAGQPRHVANFEVQLLIPGPPQKLRAADVSRGGLFLCTELALPPLFSRVKLSLPRPGGGDFEVSGEVVRHVSAEEAKAWGMAPGFGVQFVDLLPESRALLVQLVSQGPLAATAPPAPVVSSASTQLDSDTQNILEHLRTRVHANHYQLLDVSSDTDMAGIRNAAKSIDGRIRTALEKASAELQAPLRAGLERLREALETLSNPGKRVDYDAHRGNFRGVARCLEAGFPVAELTNRHKQFLAARPGLDVKIAQQMGRIRVARGRGNLPAALRECETALESDPLNPDLQRGWAELRRLAATAK